jgi:hypothetical protein
VKLRKFLTVVFVLSSALSFSTLSKAEQSSPGNFYCGTVEGVPAVMNEHPDRGRIVLMKLVSNYFNGGGYSPEVRCPMIAKKFQQNQRNGTLKYLVAGKNKGMNVVCASTTKMGFNPNCKDSAVLFTHNPTKDSLSKVIEQIYSVNSDANADPLNQVSGGLYGSEEEDNFSLDVEKFMGTVANQVK